MLISIRFLFILDCCRGDKAVVCVCETAKGTRIASISNAATCVWFWLFIGLGVIVARRRKCEGGAADESRSAAHWQRCSRRVQYRRRRFARCVQEILARRRAVEQLGSVIETEHHRIIVLAAAFRASFHRLNSIPGSRLV